MELYWWVAIIAAVLGFLWLMFKIGAFRVLGYILEGILEVF